MHTRLTLLAAALLACGAAYAKPLTVCTEASPEGFDVVRYNSLTTTNASADVVFNRLVDYDARAGKVVPSLASSWKVADDGLSVSFTLRQNVSFHRTAWFKPGRPLNADDVVFSFQRMLNPDHPWYKTSPTGYPHAKSFQLDKLIKAVVKVDARTVRFDLNQPDATLVPLLTMGFASIYSAEYADQLARSGNFDQFNSQPVGTGPYVFQSFVKDSVVRYAANPAYFAGKPNAERLSYVITPDTAVRAQKIKAGECQISLSPKPQDIADAAGAAGVKVLSTPMFSTAFVALNSQHKPFDDKRVRQAVNLAFDKANYLKVEFAGSAIAASNPFPPSTFGYNKAVKDYPLDIARARKLLADAGYGNGFDTTIWVRPTGSTLNPNPKAGAELLQADLAKVGIKAEIKVLEWGELIKRGKAGEHDLLFMGWAGDNGDADNFLTPQFSCAAVQSGTNFARYCDPALDKLITDARRIANPKQRAANYAKAQQIIKEQALWLPLAHPTAAVLTTGNVSGFQVSPFGRVDFSRVVVK
ncbi:ABC transporter substrate-binding protein [Vogesella sp. LIG4]|uniref:ABC transporter substrate-binding protein n=1 Tax=Vogesella sp. LIG4 TaxID=1192162 RepID=UPI00082011CF|nr:ABC transporter substrate-binding protein [Vogesella sp. LIG4]SCK22288.1 dipeptide transport system substrate-binding protein [Vogesella sp. LIG4]